ncbi:hypothetical protein BpHYR1_015786 [Brachionus plicatilis]|uniref:Uncharacterized protein n=1 Tax=Brachionus plicatilis TaxID=10195 RepID=A0A3M7T3J1_BRAPC|nr:hypothetical protein BpHYR1_015786 [Brachionus plicatilis]
MTLFDLRKSTLDIYLLFKMALSSKTPFTIVLESYHNLKENRKILRYHKKSSTHWKSSFEPFVKNCYKEKLLGNNQ